MPTRATRTTSPSWSNVVGSVRRCVRTDVRVGRGGATLRAVEPIFHIADAVAWERARTSGDYRCSTLGRTLDEVGFIHCSRRGQVAAVANARYRGSPRLVLLVIDPDAVRAEIRDEDLEGTGEVFPHVYGPLNVDAVVEVRPFVAGPDGSFTAPHWP
jgi:glutathione S-transferase